MEGRFNQDLPEYLQAAFQKAMNFEPHILTKQMINTRRVNEVNKINISQYGEEFEINEAHVQNPNYKVRPMTGIIRIETKPVITITVPAMAPVAQ